MEHKLANRVSSITDNILKDYQNNRTIDEIKTFDHPNKDAVIEILDKLKKIIFPGYYKNDSFKIMSIDQTGDFISLYFPL